jgi:flagellar biosynthetic protein FliQ
MTPELAMDLIRELLRLCLLLAGPLLAVALFAGLVSAVLQAVTQVHEHTLSFVPKALAVLLALVIGFPWLLARLSEYASQLIGNIPERL